MIITRHPTTGEPVADLAAIHNNKSSYSVDGSPREGLRNLHRKEALAVPSRWQESGKGLPSSTDFRESSSFEFVKEVPKGYEVRYDLWELLKGRPYDPAIDEAPEDPPNGDGDPAPTE